MRPTGLTFVISVITSAAAPSENWPRCMRCQSLAVPSVELYWHIGETTTRFGSVRPRMVIGEHSALVIFEVSPLESRPREAARSIRTSRGRSLEAVAFEPARGIGIERGARRAVEAGHVGLHPVAGFGL